MNENEMLDVTKEVVKEIAKDAYEDAGKPIAKPAGELLGLVPRAIKAALLPVEKWILTRENNLEETRLLLEQKLENVSPEMIESPEPYIAVPALQYISYCMDNEELRDMYANLLANSMNTVVKNGVHPSYVEIIKQLSPDEAKILRFIFSTEQNSIPTLEFRAHKEKGYATLIKRFTNITELCDCENVKDHEKYIDNLLRLGLLRESGGSYLVDDAVYLPLENHTYIKNLKQQIENSEEISKIVKRVELSRRYVELTSYGKSFCSICLQTKKSIIVSVEQDKNP